MDACVHADVPPVCRFLNVFTSGLSRAEVRLCNDKNPQRRRQGHLVLHTHYAESLGKHNVRGNSRRGWLALGICLITESCAESVFAEKQQKANAAQEENLNNNDDMTSRTHAEGSDSSPDSSLNGLLSLFDRNEKTKLGKVLPKGYLKSARQVVKSLRESLKEESSKEGDVRRSADSAKEAIRDYLQNWRGQKLVESEDSYKALEGAIKILGKFYAKQGPRAVLPSDVKSQILTNLEVADAAL